MDCIITPIIDTCFRCWDRSAKYRVPIKGLRRSLKNLSVEKGRLINVRNDVEGRVDRETQELHQVPTDQVSGWLRRVEHISNEVDGIIQRGDAALQKNCMGGHCPTNCRSRYKLATEVDQLKASVKEELDIGEKFIEVTFKPVESSSAVGPQEPTVGMNVMFDTVREWVEDNALRSISLFGVGGVGKTTLLKRVYDHFNRVNPDNHIVLWAVVSQPVNIEQIQKKIWQQLKFTDEDWESIDKEARSIKMQNYLRDKNFMLFLDDLWESIRLPQVGIPPTPQPNSKVIFSTRQEEVCTQMQATTSMTPYNRMKVECLAPEDALRLFRQKVGEETWTASPTIPGLAETVVKECKYLPLALTVVAKAMVGKKQPHQWEEAIKHLRKNMAEFPGMQEEVLKILKFSFDALPNETHKKCFLYCCLFPEDFEMGKYDLMNLWIGEGYFHECDNIHDARNCCEDVLDKLTTTCLLEECPYDLKIGKSGSYESYKLHDVVREMALWVARERKILVVQDQGAIGLHELNTWNDKEMISVMHAGTKFHQVPTALPCLNLSTLILRRTKLARFAIGFFSSMPSLKVLDLSWNQQLCSLEADIGELKNLEYLNIQQTRITMLPDEFKKLKKVKYLLLNRDVDMDKETVSSIIPSLVVFDNCGGASRARQGRKLLEFLQGMDAEKHEVSLRLQFDSEMKELWTYQGLQSCLRYLSLLDSRKVASITFPESSVERMRHFEYLDLNTCLDLKEIRISSKNTSCFHNLRRVVVFCCQSLKDLTSLIYYAPNLDTLVLMRCTSMTAVVRTGDVRGEIQAVIFSSLKVLILDDLRSLKSICGRPLPFPSLRWMSCFSCPKLRKLPFCVDDGNNQFSKLQKIQGQQEWWNSLEWDDNVATQQLLAPKFVPR